MDALEKHVMPLANKIGSQKHLQAVRNGIIATLPLTIVGSFFLIFLNIPIPSYMEFINAHRNSLEIPFRFTVGMMSLFCSFSIAACLAKSYDCDTVTCGFLGVLGFLCVSIVPVQVTAPIEGVIAAGRYLNLSSLSAANLFSSILCGLFSVEIFRFMKDHNITIKMPEGVPEGVANSFAALFPALAVLIIFWGLRHILNVDINSILTALLMPLKQFLVGNSLLGGLITVFLNGFFWILGIHGAAIMGPVIRPMWDAAIAENMDAFANGTAASALPNIFTEQFFQWFVWIGGSGMTLALVILFMFSKSQFFKKLGGLAFLPSLFNINEPVMFGAPIVMNPILGIPFVLVPLICTFITYIFTISGWIPLMMARLPFTIPAPIAAIISTNWSIMAGILVIINLTIGILIYYPFFKKYEEAILKNEKSEK